MRRAVVTTSCLIWRNLFCVLSRSTERTPSPLLPIETSTLERAQVVSSALVLSLFLNRRKIRDARTPPLSTDSPALGARECCGQSVDFAPNSSTEFDALMVPSWCPLVPWADEWED